MQKLSYRAGQAVRIHSLEWFKANRVAGRYTLKGLFEYDWGMIRDIAGRKGRILQAHDDLGLYDVTIGQRIYQVEAVFFNDRRKYGAPCGQRGGGRS